MTHPGPETSLGGQARDFPSTVWSRILGAGSEDAASRQAAIERLAGSYWKPVYAYIRCRWAKSNEDAKDLTQDFFLWMMEKEIPDRADPDRGRFRAFLKVCLDRYLAGEERKHRREKRAGSRRIVSLEGDFAKSPAGDLPDMASRTPEQVLDEIWRAELFTRALAQLEEACRSDGREVCASVFRDYYLCESAEMDYKQVASTYGISVSDVSNHLMSAKKRFREILMRLVMETVGGPAELAEELKHLFGDQPS